MSVSESESESESVTVPPGGRDPSGGEPRPAFRDLARDALRYWEPRRLLYNVVLLAVVLVHFWSGWPASRAFVSTDSFLLLVILAVIANVAYCAAYPVDLFVQFSGAREAWRYGRWCLLALGTVLAVALAHFATVALLSDDLHP